jgi:glyoxylase-like metal-dependent hydrolase (beta-lactamase superfamily II)
MQRSEGSDANRRMVLRGIAGALTGFTLAPAARVGRAASGVVATPVAAGITLLSGGGGNIVVLATDAGKVAVDSGAAAFGGAVRATLDELPGGRVTTLFNTHWHLDQVGSNEALGGAGATIVAHEKTRLRLTTGYYVPTEDRYEKPLPEAARPTKTVRTHDTLSVGGRHIEYGYLLEAHTDGDIYVAFPDANVIAVGDVVSPVRDPVLDWFGGGWLGGRVDALAGLLERSNANTRFVPSYGPVLSRADVQAEHDLMLKVFDIMVEHVRLGESSEDILEAGVLDGIGRKLDDPSKFLYDVHKGFWAHHNKLTHDIV